MEANGKVSWMQHRLKTACLFLRPVQESDIPAIQKAASAFAVADAMISIPHPYPEDEAQRFVETQRELMSKKQSLTFSMIETEKKAFIGLISLRDFEPEHQTAELSFWVAPNAQGRGYMTEALPSVLDLAFKHLELNRIYAYHMLRNVPSGRVLEKCGLRPEGPKHGVKCGKFEDVLLRAVLREEWSKISEQLISRVRERYAVELGGS
ncbi:unnamed protein product [Durusdinium trenchii]|uniref:Uncharacterized N-acetyltransferase YnaD n=2 Tax=Durusdinium trenchii TaxID=1381693 RepID=A0ABP0JP23_9DINO